MRLCWLAFVVFACSTSAKAPAPTSNTSDSNASNHGGTTSSSVATNTQGSQNTMTAPDANQPGGTGIDQNGVLLRSKPDPNAPPPDPAMLADDDANTLYFCGGLAGDSALQKKAWLQLGLIDGAGNSTPKMAEFIRANTEWMKSHASVIAPYATAAKAKAYLQAHLK
jgi:hypothetical protein